MRNGHVARLVTLGILLAFTGCNKTGTSPDSTNAPNPSGSANSSGSSGSSNSSPSAAGGAASAQNGSAASNQSAAAPAPTPIDIDAGKVLAVTVDQEISTKTNATGDHFEASLAEPITENGSEILPKGTHVRGTVMESAQAGHLKGGAVLTIRLTSLNWNGQSYDIHTDSYTAEGKTRGKRTAVGAGGGAAFGAIVGAIAGGGKGAAIGAAAGGGAGTAGAAATGNRDVSIPAETRLHFRLTKHFSISQ
jgi:hypothetical protein